MMVAFIAFFFGWLFSLGSNLFKRLPAKAKMSFTRFQVFFSIPVIYMLVLCGFMAISYSDTPSTTPTAPWIVLLIIPVHLFSMFCVFYCLYFVAKTLKAVEWQKPVTFSDYVGEFFLLWFFPIGVWFIQPRINKLFGSTPSLSSLPDSPSQP